MNEGKVKLDLSWRLAVISAVINIVTLPFGILLKWHKLLPLKFSESFFINNGSFIIVGY